MPRPRSSTFYLPLAPVDAPLSLKAKLSVLPPSAANALLAPRTTAHQPPPPLPPTCSPSGRQESTLSTASALTSSLSGSVAGEDECARLERVLGLSTHVGSSRRTTTTRRHTDAPLPRTDFTNGPSASSMPSPPSQPLPPPLEVLTSLLPGTPPTPALSHSSSSDSCDSSSSETMDMDMDASFVGIDQATHLDSATDRFSNDAYHVPLSTHKDNAPVYRRLSASAPLTQMMVTVEQRSTTEHSGLQAEASTTPSAPGLTNAERRRNSGTEILFDASVSVPFTKVEDRPIRAAGLPLLRSSRTTAIVEEVMQRPTTLSSLPCGFSKVWACRPSMPSRLSSSITPTIDSDSSSSAAATPVITSRPSPSLYNVHFLSSGSLHVSDVRHLLPRQFRMPYPPPPPPCSLPSAVDSTPYISNFIPSPVNNIPTTSEAAASNCTGPATMLATSTSTLVSAPSSHPVAASTQDVASFEKSHLDMDDEDEDLEIDPDEELDHDSTVPTPCIPPSAEEEEDVHCAAITLTPPSTPQPNPCTFTSHSSQSSLYPQQHASYPTQLFTPVTRPAPPPRQRFRLAPVYLNKLLRRSLGQTAWAREETIRVARSVERRYGCALVSKAMGGHCREADRWEDFADYGGSRCSEGSYYGSTMKRSSSLVWSGYEDVQEQEENGDGDVFAANGDYSGVISSNGHMVDSRQQQFVEGEWVEEVFADGSYVGWDLDLENECTEFEGDGEEEEDAMGEHDGDVQMMMMEPEVEIEIEMGGRDEEEEDVTVSGTFVREGAPEPEDRRFPFRQHDGHGLLRVQDDDEEEDTRSPSPDGYGGYAMLGKFTWNSDWPSSPVSPAHESAPTTTTLTYREPPATPYHPVLSPPSSDVAYASSSLLPPFSRSDQVEGEEENLFRYSPMQLPQEDSIATEEQEDQFRYSPLDEEHPQGHMDVDNSDRPFLSATAASSTDSIPISLSPSFPPAPLLGTKISSEDGLSECGTITDEEDDEDRFYESDGDAPMVDRNDDKKDKKPKPDVVQEISYTPAQVDFASSPATGVFIIPPSPLGTFSFDSVPPPVAEYNRASPDVPCSPISPSWTYVPSSPIHPLPHQPAYPPHPPPSQPVLPSNTVPTSPEHTPRRSIERFRLARSSMERIRPARRSMEWIKPTSSSSIGSPPTASSPTLTTHPYEANGGPVLVAPRPRRASRALENVFSQQSPVLKACSSLPPVSSPPLTHDDSSSSSTSPPPRPAPAAWTFGSLKSALSSSVSHIVELARSRSPSPLPWLMRGFNNSSSESSNTIASISSVLLPSTFGRLSPSEKEELEAERSGCATPTPSSRSRSASTITITESNVKRSAAVPQLHLDTSNEAKDMSSSPPPKRTLSTSSLSSMESEPESESGSSGGVFSRSPSPEPNSERAQDPSHSLTPRSRPMSADAKATMACGGRLSPMMIPGSWDPNELWEDDVEISSA